MPTRTRRAGDCTRPTASDPQRLQQWTQANIADGASFQAVVAIGGQSGFGGSREIRILSLNKNDMLRRQQAALSLAPEFLSRVENYDLGIRVQSVPPIGDAAAVVRTRITESGTIGVNAAARQFGSSQGMSQGMNQGMTQEMAQGMTQRPETQGMGPARGHGQDQIQDQGQGQAQGQDRAQQHAQNEGQNEIFQRGPGDSGRFRQRTGQGVSFNADAECTQLVQRDQNAGRLTIGLSNCNAEMQF